MKYIIYSPLYNENIGGVIALHKLCSILNSLGYNALWWEFERPNVSDLLSCSGLKRIVSWFLRFKIPMLLGFKKNLNPHKLNLACKRDINDSIVLYPEIVEGNPLGSKKVVRWFLNKPGIFTGIVNYGAKDLCFCYAKHFDDGNFNKIASDVLYVVDFKKNVYYNKKTKRDIEFCYMVRKRNDIKLNEHLEGDVCIDEMSHVEISNIFNRCEYFICYDLYTMYARYAVICGCIPVIIPDLEISKEKWRPKKDDRYALAYGWDDLKWAIETREDLIMYLKQIDLISERSVKNFVKKTSDYFK